MFAQKEAKEETGLSNLKLLSDGIFGIQILPVDSHIKRGKFVPSHLHLDCCFLFEANEEDNLKIKEDENSGVKWVNIDDVIELTNENRMKPICKYVSGIQETNKALGQLRNSGNLRSPGLFLYNKCS